MFVAKFARVELKSCLQVFVVEDCCADRSREHHDGVLRIYDGSVRPNNVSAEYFGQIIFCIFGRDSLFCKKLYRQKCRNSFISAEMSIFRQK